MQTRELSSEEERHLFNLSVIPAAILTYILIALFTYFEREQQHLTLMYYLVYFGIPFAVLVPMAIFLSFEIFYSHKVGKPIAYYRNRLFGRMSIIFMGVSTFIAVLATTYFSLAASTDQWNILLLSGVVWFGIWVILVGRSKNFLNKLYKGQW